MLKQVTTTAYTIDSVDVSGFTITITLDSNVAPTNKGTYSYDPGSTSALSVTNIHNVLHWYTPRKLIRIAST